MSYDRTFAVLHAGRSKYYLYLSIIFLSLATELNKLVPYLYEKVKGTLPFAQVVQLRPIMSSTNLSVCLYTKCARSEFIGVSFQDVNSLVQMETLCSMLVGPEGNQGFDFVGRVEIGTKEDLIAGGKYLQH